MQKLIYTEAMAQALINEGFELIGKFPNARNLKKTVWVFDSSPELEKACNKYIEDSKARRVKQAKPDTPKLSRRAIAEMYLEKKLPIETIAKTTHKSEDEVKAAIDSQVDLFKLLAIAAMSDKELRQLMDAQTDEERNQIITDRLKRGGFFVYGGRDSYDFPSSAEEEETCTDE